MAVYVDHARVPMRVPRKGTWRMSHMIADTRSELDAMAENLDLAERWKQKPGEQKEHFDVTENYRRSAIFYGAKEITVRELVTKLRYRDLKHYLEN